MPLDIRNSERSTRFSQLSSIISLSMQELRDNRDFMRFSVRLSGGGVTSIVPFPSQGCFEQGVIHPSLVCSNIGYQKCGLDLKPEHDGMSQQVVLKIIAVRQEQSVLRYATAN